MSPRNRALLQATGIALAVLVILTLTREHKYWDRGPHKPWLSFAIAAPLVLLSVLVAAIATRHKD